MFEENELQKLTEQLIVTILNNFTLNQLDEFTIHSKDDLSAFHFSLGLWIRNYILYNENDICKIFKRHDISHVDDMSAYILKHLHDNLNEKEKAKINYTNN